MDWERYEMMKQVNVKDHVPTDNNQNKQNAKKKPT